MNDAGWQQWIQIIFVAIIFLGPVLRAIFQAVAGAFRQQGQQGPPGQRPRAEDILRELGRDVEAEVERRRQPPPLDEGRGPEERRPPEPRRNRDPLAEPRPQRAEAPARRPQVRRGRLERPARRPPPPPPQEVPQGGRRRFRPIEHLETATFAPIDHLETATFKPIEELDAAPLPSELGSLNVQAAPRGPEGELLIEGMTPRQLVVAQIILGRPVGARSAGSSFLERD